MKVAFLYICSILLLRPTFLTVQTERSLVGTKGGEPAGRFLHILLPFTQPPSGRGHNSSKPCLLHTSKHLHPPSLCLRFELIASLRIISDVERVVASSKLLVISSLHHKCVSLSSDHINFWYE